MKNKRYSTVSWNKKLPRVLKPDLGRAFLFTVLYYRRRGPSAIERPAHIKRVVSVNWIALKIVITSLQVQSLNSASILALYEAGRAGHKKLSADSASLEHKTTRRGDGF